MPETAKRLRVFAGPNGSGKSTVNAMILANYYAGPFINADELHRELLQKGSVSLSRFQLSSPKSYFDDYLAGEGKSWIERIQKDDIACKLTCRENTLAVQEAPGPYDAAIAADFIRHLLVRNGDTFTFETVLSNARKATFLQKAQKTGYQVFLYFICTIDPEINKIRVANRVKKGGDPVAPEKIQARYYHSLDVLSRVIPFTHRCFLFDNSGDGKAEILIADIEDGKTLTIHSNKVPWWVGKYVIEKLF